MQAFEVGLRATLTARGHAAAEVILAVDAAWPAGYHVVAREGGQSVAAIVHSSELVDELEGRFVGEQLADALDRGQAGAARVREMALVSS